MVSHQSTPCHYCDSLLVARKGNNFCSNQGDDLRKKRSNAFYIKSQSISSGSHISRLTIRAVFEGYQFYEVEGADHMLKKDNYLIVNQGYNYRSEIDSTKPLEALIVAFNPEFVDDFLRVNEVCPEHLLDEPEVGPEQSNTFFENTYASDAQISHLLGQIRAGILNEEGSLFFDGLYYQLLERMFEMHSVTLDHVHQIPLMRTSTKIELFRRIGMAKDYIDAHIKEDLDIDEISQVAALSSFHFLRMFKLIYGQTPHNYITSERMKLAAFLLNSSELPVGQVCQEVGFENISSFGRLFRSRFGVTASEFRKQA